MKRRGYVYALICVYLNRCANVKKDKEEERGRGCK